MSAGPIRLADADASAEIALQGAELRTWTVRGRPLIWTPDPAVWADTAPILFPVVGWTRNAEIRVEGRTYPLGLHGFARHRRFEIVAQSAAEVRLRLAADDETRALYPFDWSLEIAYALDGPALSTTLVVRNEGAGPMPYACGLHPGFRWPFAGGAADEYEIVFAEREGALVPEISADGLFMPSRRKIPIDGRHLALTPDLFAREALCFLEARSRSLRFAHRSGAAIDVALDDFPHIALWSRPPGAFLCIEAWTGHGDAVDADGDLFTKPSMRHLAPGGRAAHRTKFSFTSPHLLFR